MREFDRLDALHLELVPAGRLSRGARDAGCGKADAFAADDALLRGLLVETGRTTEFRIVGDMLSFEPYGIVSARDDPASPT